MKQCPVLRTIALVLALAILVAIALTRRDFSRPNLEIFTEMVRSPAYQSLSSNPVFRNGRTQQRPVEGTIPRGFLPVHFRGTSEDRASAAKVLVNPVPLSYGVLQEGRHLYRTFCKHCHGETGRGDGGVARRTPAFAMAINTRAAADLPAGEIFHIISYGRNNMPGHRTQIRQADRWKIIHYVRDLQQQENLRLAKMGLLYEEEEDPRKYSLVSAEYGKELYAANCASCHGKDGLEPQRGIPTLNHPRVLSITDENYYLDIITHGRKGTAMPSWAKTMTPTQIRSVAMYIRSWVSLHSNRREIAEESGDIRNGRAVFRGNCAPCHGLHGEGGIGLRLNSQSFLAIASNSFLRDTITLGRKHTAMPSGFRFDSEELSDLMAYIRSWGPLRSTYEEVAKLLPKGSKRIGKKLFRARCAGCHGKKGEGGIGSRLNSQSFLSLASDKFLYRAITEGRPGTAMPFWRSFTSEDVADLMTYIRDWQKKPAAKLTDKKHQGRPEFGGLLFNMACKACHGPDGRGGVGGQIGNPVFLSSASDDFLWNTIAHGKDETAMRGFLKDTPGGALVPMSPSDINHVVAYLRQLEKRDSVEPLMRPRPGTSLEQGREIFEKKGGCAKCHGARGEGASGPALGNRDFLRVASDGYLAATIILGRENTEMLSFFRGGNVKLSMQDVENVVSYVRNFERQEHLPRRYVDRSETAVQVGKGLFQKNCAGCHGSEGKGPGPEQLIRGYAPSINNQEFLSAADDSFLLATIAIGRPGTPMRPFGRGAGGIADLSADEIRKIVAYIRSWEKQH